MTMTRGERWAMANTYFKLKDHISSSDQEFTTEQLIRYELTNDEEYCPSPVVKLSEMFTRLLDSLEISDEEKLRIIGTTHFKLKKDE